MTRETKDTTITPSANVELAAEGTLYSKAMMKLEPTHRRFVEALFNMQKRDFEKAYILAKWGDSLAAEGDDIDIKRSRSSYVMGSRWAQREDVKEAIFAEGARRMTAYVPMIMEMLASIALDPDHKDAARVGLGILDRTGFGPTKKVDQTMTVQGAVEVTKIDVTDPRTAVALRKFAAALNLNGDDFATYVGAELAKRTEIPMIDVTPAAEFDWTLPEE